MILRGCEALAPAAKAIRPPLRYETLAHIISKLDIHGNKPDAGEIAFAACVLVTYALMARLRKTTVEKHTSPIAGYTSTTSEVRIIPPTSSTPTHALIKLPFDKVKRQEGRDLIIVSQSMVPSLNPITALQRHIQVKNPGPDRAHFSYQTRNDPDTYLPITHGYVTRHIDEILAAADPPLEEIDGHCLRFGSASHFLKLQVHPDIVKQSGSWKSDSFLRYWRNISTIAARTMADLEVESDISALMSAPGANYDAEEVAEDTGADEDSGSEAISAPAKRKAARVAAANISEVATGGRSKRRRH